MSKEIHEMTLSEAKTELEKLRTELCLKYHADGDEKTKKLIQAISIVIDNCHYSYQFVKGEKQEMNDHERMGYT